MELVDALTIESADVHDPQVSLLLARLTEELAQRYNDDGAGDFKPADVQKPRSAFLVVRCNGKLIACGAYRPMTDDIAEIKRMYVERAYRGRGIGKRLLAALENGVRLAGYAKIWLDTGTSQPEAMGLYQAAGYQRIPPFGMYCNDPRCVCFEKTLQSVANKHILVLE
jgi:GNAT superfamily N-acetyltransferase